MENKPYFAYSAHQEVTFVHSDSHYHNSYEIYYLTRGRCWYFIGKHSYLLSAGDVALIPPGVIHRTSYETPTHSRKLINCAESFIPASVRPMAEELASFTPTPAAQKHIERIFMAIEKERDHPDVFSEDVIANKVRELMLLMARESRQGEQVKTESPLVEQVAAYIAENYHTAVTLSDVAKACYVSREHLSRTFKKEAGFGFGEYLTLYRMKKADALLREGPDIPVAEVAARCGFNDSNYFSKVYKKMFGISPLCAKKEKNDV